MAMLQDLETALNDIFVKKAPALPDGAKKFLLTYLPWINLALGVFALWAAAFLWHEANQVNHAADFVNRLSAVYGTGEVVSKNHLTLTVWLALAVLVVEAVIYVLAFPATRDRKKQGWNLMFYAILINVVYGFVVMFTYNGGFLNFFASLVGTAIGLYLLFQIREGYLGSKPNKSDKPAKTE